MKALLAAQSFILAVSILANADSLSVSVPADSVKSSTAAESAAVSSNQDQGAYVYFDSFPAKHYYKPFHGEKVINSCGYGIYYDGSRANMAYEDGAMVINFNFDAVYGRDGGGWISVRKAFDQVQNLGRYSGVEMEINTNKIAKKKRSHFDCFLRFTLCDIGTSYSSKEDPARIRGESSDAYKRWKKDGFDYMWWSNKYQSIYEESYARGTELRKSAVILRRIKDGWVKVRFPFSSFDAAFGGGTRNRCGKIDTHRITAYEICLLGRGSEGNLLFRNVRAYNK